MYVFMSWINTAFSQLALLTESTSYSCTWQVYSLESRNSLRYSIFTWFLNYITSWIFLHKYRFPTIFWLKHQRVLLSSITIDMPMWFYCISNSPSAQETCVNYIVHVLFHIIIIAIQVFTSYNILLIKISSNIIMKGLTLMACDVSI